MACAVWKDEQTEEEQTEQGRVSIWKIEDNSSSIPEDEYNIEAIKQSGFDVVLVLWHSLRQSL